MWSNHMSTLLQISTLRQAIYKGERYPFIVWWICNIDIYALFSGAGHGEYVGSMLLTETIPLPQYHLYPLSSDGSSIVYSDEISTLPKVLQLNYEVTMRAAKLGFPAQELRREMAYMTEEMSSQQPHANTKLRQTRVYELQESLRALWLVEPVTRITQSLKSLPLRSKQLFEHATILYGACIIYSHTSMWPTQRLDTGPEFDVEISQAVSEILHTAGNIVDTGRFEVRSIIFPLFMAGFASIDDHQKSLAMDLITIMEKEKIGGNTAATRNALQVVYERQKQRFMHTGHSLDVDWIEVIAELGVRILDFGL